MNINVSPVTICTLKKKVRQMREILDYDRGRIHIYEQLPPPMDKYGIYVYCTGGIFSDIMFELKRIPFEATDFNSWNLISSFHGHERDESIAHKMSKIIKDELLPKYKYTNTNNKSKYTKLTYDNFVF